MRNTVDIMGIPVDKVTMQGALESVISFLSEDKVHTVYTPNAEIMMAAHREPQLKDILRRADLLVADGAGVVLASRILRRAVPQRVAGFDLIKNIFATTLHKKVRFFFFGGKIGVADVAIENILKSYPHVEVAGCRNGYFLADEEKGIVELINSSGADILLVALGAPKQERWIDAHKSELKVKVCMGIGGSFDVFAGVAKRAPEFFRKHGLEWLYRLYKEPWRFKRMLDLPRFVLLAVKMRLMGK